MSKTDPGVPILILALTGLFLAKSVTVE